jgi:hypothetical protein
MRTYGYIVPEIKCISAKRIAFAFVAFRASSTLSFFSLSSVYVCAPTYNTKQGMSCSSCFILLSILNTPRGN